jgi:uncharacterized membrane protein
MKGAPFRASAADTLAARIVIRQPVDRVFQFYRDFTNLPRFLGDVMNVEPIAPPSSRWTIQGPFRSWVCAW